MNNFSDIDRESFYKLIKARRDVRSGFLSDPIASDVLTRILTSAHYAPSVGFMQPWNFILIRDMKTRERIKENFLESSTAEAEMFSGAKKELYQSLKLEGILESPLNVCVTCDRSRGGKSGLGRSVQPEMDLYSTVCAIQNMWLAARAENVGMGWVSILDKSFLSELLKLPENVEIVAYLCLGYVEQFSENPDLEDLGWQKRLDLDKLIFTESWGENG